MAANSALCIVCPSGHDLPSMCIVMLVLGLTALAHRVRLPFTCEPSV
jgi:hypothetical protein